MDTVTADSKTIVEGLAARGNRHAVWALAKRERLTTELAAAREALECAFNWAMTEESDPNGGFDIFAEEIVPMIGKVLGRE